jgi:hydroxymethylpyrimidine/phosphomethylpyrimidine kinase
MSGEAAVLLLGGIDPTSGAGLYADIAAVRAAGLWPLAVPVALTGQTSFGVFDVTPIAPETWLAHAGALIDDFRIVAAKTGMLGTADNVEAVAGLMQGLRVPWVVDPVLVSSSGRVLLDAEAVGLLRQAVLPRAAIVTPNGPELLALSGLAVTDRDSAIAAAHVLLDQGVRAVIAKGGHWREEAGPVDLWISKEGVVEARAGVVGATDARGTGCRFAAYLAARLGAGDSGPEALVATRTYMDSLFAAGTTTPGQSHTAFFVR